jgi:hypothetical protein
MSGAIAASIFRHTSAVWADMPDVRLNYDIIFVVFFGILVFSASIGLLKKRKWGYEIAMLFNYILGLSLILPFIAIAIFYFENNIPISEMSKLEYFGNNLNNLVIGSVSVFFIILMNKANIKTLYKKK